MSNTNTPVVQQFNIDSSNVKIDPNFTLPARVGVLRLGQRVIYSPSRGCYRFGYYLGASLSQDAVCLFPSGIGRIGPHHLLPIEWQDYLIDNSTRLKQIFQDYMDLV